MIATILQIVLKLIMFFLDPSRSKRAALENEKKEDESERVRFARAVKNGDLLLVSSELDSVLRDIKRARRDRRRQEIKKI